MKKNIALSILLLISIGCSSLEKQLVKKEREAEIYYRANPVKLAELCLDEFPPQAYEYVPGETITIEKEVYVPGPIIPCPEPTTTNPNPTVQCPPCKEKIIETSRIDTIKIPDTKHTYLLQNNLNEVKSEFEKSENYQSELENKIHELELSKTNWRWSFFILLLGVVLYVLYKIFK